MKVQILDFGNEGHRRAWQNNTSDFKVLVKGRHEKLQITKRHYLLRLPQLHI